MKWISVTEQVPAESGRYAIIYRYGSLPPAIFTGDWNASDGRWSNLLPPNEILYWAEYPPIPGEQEKVEGSSPTSEVEVLRFSDIFPDNFSNEDQRFVTLENYNVVARALERVLEKAKNIQRRLLVTEMIASEETASSSNLRAELQNMKAAFARSHEVVFVRHIEGHLRMSDQVPTCKICGMTIYDIHEAAEKEKP